MGLLNFIFNGLGFESKESKSKSEKQKMSSIISKEKGKAFKADSIFPDLNSQTSPKIMTSITSGPANTTKNMLIHVPKNNKDIQIIVDALRRHESAIVNLGALNGSDTQKIIDFLSGAVYALKGNLRKLDNNLFLLTPEEINVVSPTEKQ